jgi:hypothetical protein
MCRHGRKTAGRRTAISSELIDEPKPEPSSSVMIFGVDGGLFDVTQGV